MKTFYEHQDIARGKSLRMMFLLSLAMLGTTLCTGLAVTLWVFLPAYRLFFKVVERPETVFTVHLHPDQAHPLQAFLVEHFPWAMEFPWELFGFFYAVITVAVGAAMLVVTRNKLRQLWTAGGVGVARSLGGVHVTREGYRRDDRTQRAVNVVNEIAIASRIPPPEVFVLHDEPGINAFAVGLTHRDMAVGLTAGAIRDLNREQLQGVLAHEFAHIVNGDTRTNVLLVGYLHGLMGLIICAQSLLNRGMAMMVRSISHGGQGIIGIALIIQGALLWPIGLIGLGFATLVKSAYNRQREYLADASAIEFSRNQIGLLSAMKRVLGSQYGSRVRSASCLALNHVFFAKSCGGVVGLLDSHPPLEKRIQRIDANWDGEVEFEEEHDVGQFTGVLKGTMSIAQQARSAPSGRLMETGTPEDAELAMAHETVMNVNSHAADIRAALPPQLWELTQELHSAEAMVFALWAAGTSADDCDDAELDQLGQASSMSQQVAEALKPHIASLGLAERLMLFDAAVNEIRQSCDSSDMTAFCQRAGTLLEEHAEDGDLFRWSWRKTISQIVDRELQQPRLKPRFRDVDQVLDECRVLLSALAYANESGVMEGYSLLRASNVLEHDIEILPRKECDLAAVEQSLDTLRMLAPKARRKLVIAGSASVETDSMMNEQETLLMRGICSGLGYPPATLLPGQPVKLS